MTPRTSSPLIATATPIDFSRPSLPPPTVAASSRPTSSADVPLSFPIAVSSSFPPRRPSTEWKAFFELGMASDDPSPASDLAKGNEDQEMDTAGDGQEETPTEDIWGSVFGGDQSWEEVDSPNVVATGGARASTIRSTSATMIPQQSAQSTASYASSFARSPTAGPSSSAASPTSTTATSAVASPIDHSFSREPISTPSVLAPIPSTSASVTRPTLPIVPAVLRGYSSVMPRREPPVKKAPRAKSATTSTRKHRKTKIDPEPVASSISLLAPAFDYSFPPHSPVEAPLSAPATTTTFTRRLALNTRIAKKIKAEPIEEMNPTSARVDVSAASTVPPSPFAVASQVPAAAAKAPTVKRERKKPEGYTPRPANAWILYRSAQIQLLKQDEALSRKPQSDISKLIGYMWRDELPEVKKFYEQEAVLKKAEHAAKYPDYTFQPARRNKRTASGPADGSAAASTATPDLDASVFAPAARPSHTRRITAPLPRTPPAIRYAALPPTPTSADFSSLGLSIPPFAPETLTSYGNDMYMSNSPLTLDGYGSTPLDDSNMEGLLAALAQGTFSPSQSSQGAQLSTSSTSTYNSDVDSIWATYEASAPQSYCTSPLIADHFSMPRPPMSAPASSSTFEFDFGPVQPALYSMGASNAGTPAYASWQQGVEPAAMTGAIDFSFPYGPCDL